MDEDIQDMIIRPTKRFLIGLLLLASEFIGCGKTEKQTVDVKVTEAEESVELVENVDEVDHQDYVKYFSAIKENEDYIKRFADSTRPVKYYMAYINGDDIPEMLIADDDIHPSQITIYAYDENHDKIYYLGSVGSTATLYYYPKENCVSCSYGSNGYFVAVSYSIVDGKLKADKVYAKNENNGKYYGGIKSSENLENESLDYYIDSSWDTFEITEDEIEKGMSHKVEIERVYYDEDMFDLE